MVFALMLGCFDDNWIAIPGYPQTCESAAVIVEQQVAFFSNPTASAMTGTTGNATFSLANWVRGSTDPEGLPSVPWSSPYAALSEWSLSWSDLGATYNIPAMKRLEVYYQATKNVGAESFHWWDNEEAAVGRYRTVHSNLQGRLTLATPYTSPVDPIEHGPGSE